MKTDPLFFEYALIIRDSYDVVYVGLLIVGLALGVNDTNRETSDPCELQKSVSKILGPLQPKSGPFAQVDVDFAIIGRRLKLTFHRDERVLSERFVDYDESACVPLKDHLGVLLSGFFKDFTKQPTLIPLASPGKTKPRHLKKNDARKEVKFKSEEPSFEISAETATKTPQQRRTDKAPVIASSSTTSSATLSKDKGRLSFGVFAYGQSHIDDFVLRLGARARAAYKLRNASFMARFGVQEPLRATTDSESLSVLPLSFSVGAGPCDRVFAVKLCLFGLVGREYFSGTLSTNDQQSNQQLSQWIIEGLLEYQDIIRTDMFLHVGLALRFRPGNQAFSSSTNDKLVDVSGWTGNAHIGISYDLFHFISDTKT
ncbi:MAG: hypothetical protein VYC39_03560 [Myxococcota bacterium]|nr:hypothetical protein [Myxococcota bacterium]